MIGKYKIALIAYSILLIGFLIFIFKFAMDMAEITKLAITDYVVIACVVLHILLLSLFPYLKKKMLFGILNILLLSVSVVFVSYIVLEFGWSISAISFILIYLLLSFILFVSTLKNVVSINSR